MKRPTRLLVLALTLTLTFPFQSVAGQTATEGFSYIVQPGDTWPALIWRFGLRPADLQVLNRHINRQRQPTIGSNLSRPEAHSEQLGRLLRASDGGVLLTAARFSTSPWLIAIRNGLRSPFRPLLLRPLFIPGGSEPPQDLPIDLTSLQLSRLVAQPGQALAFRARASRPISMTAMLDDSPFDVFANEENLVGLAATGAFFGDGEPMLTILVDDAPLWSQPWRFADLSWDYQQITLTGSAAAIDQQSIAEERARLFELWSVATLAPAWNQSFQLPLIEYLEISSTYGARRSYNGGPYRTYHEGVDFAATVVRRCMPQRPVRFPWPRHSTFEVMP
jgi:hypothetical protein